MLKTKNILALVLAVALSLGVCTANAEEQSSDVPYAQQFLDKLQIGMTIEEVTEVIGEPVHDLGSGRYLPTYVFADGSSFTLEFGNNNILAGVMGDTYTLSQKYLNKTELAKAVLGSDGLKIIEGVNETDLGITRAKMVEVMFKILDFADDYKNIEDFKISDYYNILYDDVDNTHWACAELKQRQGDVKQRQGDGDVVLTSKTQMSGVVVMATPFFQCLMHNFL